MNKIWIFVFLFLSAMFLFRYTIVGQAVYGDGIYYWAYTHSVYFDHDLSFFNELGHNYSHEGNNSLHEKILNRYTLTTPTGLAVNRYPPGAPLSWLPFYLLADCIVLTLRSLGYATSRNGYSDIYQIFVGIGNILYFVLGLTVLYKLLKNLFPPRISLSTTLFVLFATNLIYYSSIDVINSHPFSFFIATTYFYLWQKNYMHRPLKQWLILGLLLGMLATIRTQDIVLGLPLAFETIMLFKKKYDSTSLFKQSVAVISGFLIGFLPQLIVWYIVYGTVWKSPYVDSSSFDVIHPHILGVLLNPKTGMLYFSSLFIISLFGLWIFRKIHSSMSTIFLITIGVQFFVIASWSGWQQGEAYGTRMLISLIPVFSIGIAALMQSLLKKMQFHTLVTLCLLFILYNAIMIGIFQFYIQENSFIEGKNTQQMILNKLRIKL